MMHAPGDVFRHSFAVRTAPLLAVLLALASLGGICLTATYARETATWSAQAIGQDWVNLVVVVPCLLLSGHRAARGSRRALLLLGGGLLYVVYESLAYAFCVHFNSMFLVYCALLGVAFYALANLGTVLELNPVASWFTPPRVPFRLAGVTQVAMGVMFALLWLSEVVPALWRGTAPPSVVEAGLLTNPVHVTDLSLLLPGLILSGVSLLRRRPLGLALSPILLAFSVLMATAIGGMLAVMALRHVAVQWPLAAVFAAVAVATIVVLTRMLRAIRAD